MKGRREVKRMHSGFILPVLFFEDYLWIYFTISHIVWVNNFSQKKKRLRHYELFYMNYSLKTTCC